MATLEEGCQYGLSSNFSSFSNKSVVHVKLTDTSLKVIEDFIKRKALSGPKPTIQFQGNHGAIQIPDFDGDLRTFQFSLSSVQGDPNGSFDSVQQLNSKLGHRLQFEGSMTNRINIHATKEVFKTTKERVTQAELDSKKVSTKVIKQSGPRISKKKTTVIKNLPSSALSHPKLPTNVLPAKPKPPTAPPVNFSKRPSPSYGSQGHAVSPHNPTVSSNVSHTKPLSPSLSSTTSSSAVSRSSGNPAVMSMPYRDRIIHLLAIRPYKKPELIIRLRKDGIRDKDKDSLGSILNQVAVTKDNSFTLAKHAYADVRMDWPFYTDEDKEKLKKKLDALAPSPSSSPANRSPDSPSSMQLKRAEPQKRLAEESTHHQSSKKKRISMVEKTSHREENPDTGHVLSTIDTKSEKKENISDMSVNAISESPDYIRKYNSIQNTDQRQRYKQEFNTDYEEYKELHSNVEKVSRKFIQLKALLKDTPRHTPKYEKLKERICSEYTQQKGDAKYLEQKKRFDYLHGKLAYIKNLILEYDQNHFSAGS